MSKILLVGLGGFLGAISRFGVSSFIRHSFPQTFPVATFAINFVGCIGIGLLYESFRNHPLLPSLSLFLVVGFLGSFTTFSTFSFETIELAKQQHFQLAITNVVGSVLVCLAGVLIGEWMGRLL